MSSAAAKVRGAGSTLSLRSVPAWREGSGGRWRRRSWRERGAGRRFSASLGLALSPAAAAHWDRGLNRPLVPRTPREGRDGGSREACTPLRSVSHTDLRCPGRRPRLCLSGEQGIAPMLNKSNAFQSGGGVYFKRVHPCELLAPTPAAEALSLGANLFLLLIYTFTF